MRNKTNLSRIRRAVILPIVFMSLLQACSTAPTLTSSTTVFDQAAYDSALKLMKQKKFEQAATRLEKIARTDTERAGPYINLGIAYRQLGKLEEARQTLRIASKRKGGEAIAFNELGIVYRKLGEFKSARNAYKKSIRKQSRYAKAYLNLGILCDIYIEDLSCAMRNYKRYLSVSKKDEAKVRFWLADLRKRASKSARKKQ